MLITIFCIVTKSQNQCLMVVDYFPMDLVSMMLVLLNLLSLMNLCKKHMDMVHQVFLITRNVILMLAQVSYSMNASNDLQWVKVIQIHRCIVHGNSVSIRRNENKKKNVIFGKFLVNVKNCSIQNRKRIQILMHNNLLKGENCSKIGFNQKMWSLMNQVDLNNQ